MVELHTYKDVQAWLDGDGSALVAELKSRLNILTDIEVDGCLRDRTAFIVFRFEPGNRMAGPIKIEMSQTVESMTMILNAIADAVEAERTNKDPYAEYYKSDHPAPEGVPWPSRGRPTGKR